MFSAGQLVDAQNLGDPGTTTAGKFTPNWVPAFKNPVHGLIIISGDGQDTVNKILAQVEAILQVGKQDAAIHEVLKVIGVVRPGDQKGHEQWVKFPLCSKGRSQQKSYSFGFLDGISNPAVAGFDTNPNPGQETVPANIILLQSDSTPARPAWAVDGSFLAFRYLFQLVPEFNDFLNKNPIVLPGLTPKQGSEFLGARLVGRWKSGMHRKLSFLGFKLMKERSIGAPVDLAPLVDDPVLGADPLRNNNFSYTFPGDFDTQTRCPFAAHLRKTNPRNDLEHDGGSTTARRLIRRGIQFGPEVTPAEVLDNKTHIGRGLLFVCYQSDLSKGFQFVQTSALLRFCTRVTVQTPITFLIIEWANNTAFPPKTGVTPGTDAIIGQASDPSSRSISGTDPNQPGNFLKLPAEWVVPQGGEYFFSPSISALRNTFALGVQTQ